MVYRLWRTTQGAYVEVDGRLFTLDELSWDDLFRDPNITEEIARATKDGEPLGERPRQEDLLPPIGSQEVWAAGVTYYRSRSARMEESAGEGDFYDRVYSAPRPELFFKASPHRAVGHGQPVRIRSDARWSVPEPELTVCVSSGGRIFGYTIGNDMSSRDIEGENPLYLPQAKVYDGCCALGPCILLRDCPETASHVRKGTVPLSLRENRDSPQVTSGQLHSGDPLPDATEIAMQVVRGGATVFSGSTELAQMKRKPEELVDYLFRDNSFPNGCFLLTGTGIVPPSDFTLQSGDRIRITIEPIGTLENTVV